MRFISMTRLCLLAIFVLSLFSCTKKTEVFQTEALSDYVPLSMGKYITYRIDSTVFTNFGRSTEIHSYQVKHVIESQFTDNLGRPSYRVLRYLRDTAGTQPWTPAGSYFITELFDQVESVEDNLRVIKMHAPIRNDFTWKGNKYLNSNPYNSLYSFTNDDDMDTWDFYYKNTNDVFKYNQQTLSNVAKIVQIDERFALDTADVIGNKVNILQNSDATYIRGNATDTIRITANKPTQGHDRLIIYNQSDHIASLNKINIPAGLALNFEYSFVDTLNKWYYPNPVTVVNKTATIVGDASISYIFGTSPIDTIYINPLVDTNKTKKLTIYNKAIKTVYLNSIPIPPGFGRSYELKNKQWTYYNGINVLLDKDPYITDLPFGSTNYSVEQYAKNIGLVYKELIMWDYQPNTGGVGGAYKTGFGIKMWMIDHN